MLIRIFATSLPLIALPALAADSPVPTGITSVGPAAFLFTIAGALLLTLVFRSVASHMMRVLTRRVGAFRVRRALEARSPDVLHDFILPAGGILCIQTKHYSGIVFGEPDEPQWTNVDGTTRQRFLNPTIQNEGRTRALQNVVPDVPVDNVVIFTGNVEFPTPPPKNVIKAERLNSFIDKHVFGPSKVKDWDAAWLTVKSAALTDEASRKDLQAQIA